MDINSKIYVCGHTGLVGSALMQQLRNEGYNNIITQCSAELDLRNQNAVNAFFNEEKPEYVFLVAGKVGGIHANNTYPADFIYDNLMIAANVIHAAHKAQSRKLLFTGSSCIYPKVTPQPIKEEYLLSGPLEPTNDAYAIAKIAGIMMCQKYRQQYGDNFIAAQPTNLYGPNDNFNLETSHVLPALIRKFHEAAIENRETVEMWGSGAPCREFLHTSDLAQALVFLMKNYNEKDIINVGTGQEISIRDLGELIQDIVGFKGSIVWDTSKPDGTLHKMLDVSTINTLGWKAKLTLREGIEKTYNWFQANFDTIRK